MEPWKESQLELLSRTTDIDSAYSNALEFANNIGFKFFAFSTTYQTKNNHPCTIRRNNFPAEWNKEYEQKKLSEVDPVVAHCHQSMMPILLSKTVYSEVPWLWDALVEQGLQHGWSQSVHDNEGGHCSILSLAGSREPLTALELYEHLGFSIFIAHHLHALVVRSLPKPAMKRPPPHLSPREIAVLELAATGKTAEQSARILNLSPRTVHFHTQSCIEKLGVCNKISAIIAAIQAGYLNSNSIR
jgi:LuxR family transcriptional regulator